MKNELTIGRILRMVRQVQGLSLDDICRRAAISIPFLSLVERGKRNASVDVLSRLGSALSLPVQVLLVLGQSNDGSLTCTDARSRRLLKPIRMMADAEDCLCKAIKKP